MTSATVTGKGQVTIPVGVGVVPRPSALVTLEDMDEAIAGGARTSAP